MIRSMMEYENFVLAAQQLPSIGTREVADAAVKAVIGTLASQFNEYGADMLTKRLPAPLNASRLHSHQVGALPITTDEFVREIAEQFHLDRDDARRVIQQVLHVTKQAGLPGTMLARLPSDWIALIDEA